MSDSRIAQARALLDDARTNIADVADEVTDSDQWQVAHWLKEAGEKINGALSYLEKIQ